MVVVAPPPEETRRLPKALKSNIAQMRRAFQAWKVSKSNAQLEPLLIELVESVDSIYTLLEKQHPAELR
jgi:hypothetical protein